MIDVRTYLPGDEAGIVELHARAFGRPITEEYWRWKLKARASIVETVFVAVDGARPIFHYGGSPRTYRLAGGEVAAMASGDAMTAPEHRRQGWLTRVAGLAHATWRDAGIAFVIGIPGPNWGSRVTALGWTPLFPLQSVICPLGVEALLRHRAQRFGFGLGPSGLGIDHAWRWMRRVRRARADDLVVERIARTDAELDRLWERFCREDSRASVVRDQAWVAWRYLSQPSYVYRVYVARRGTKAAGWIVVRIEDARGRRTGYIVDLFVPSPDADARAMLIDHVLEELFFEGVEKAQAMVAKETVEHHALRRAGFVVEYGSVMAQIQSLATSLPLDVLLDQRRFLVLGGDFDFA